MTFSPIAPLSSSGALTRRQFGRWLALTTALPFTLRAQGTTAPRTPPIGVQTSLRRAAEVKAAGGDFIAESVSGFLRPDGPESEFQAVLQAVQEAPLPIYSCNFFIGRADLRSTGPDANHDAVLAYAERAFRRAHQVGVKVITFGSCVSRRLPVGFDQDEGKRQFATLLARMGPLAQKHDIIVAVESLQTRECNFLTRIAEVGAVVRRAGHPNIRVAADLYHMAAEGDTARDLAEVLDVLAHIEMAELEGRRIPGTTQQDFRPYFRVLKDGGYRGAICFEGNFEPEELASGLDAIAQQWREA